MGDTATRSGHESIADLVGIRQGGGGEVDDRLLHGVCQ